MSIKLEAQDIRLEYQQPRTGSRLVALDGVNLKIADGEFVSIVGPSGCGKTTFLSVVDGLIAASAGRILVEGKVVTKPGPDRAVVFQDASLLPWRTALGNVVYGLECVGIGKREAKMRAAHFIDLVGLAGFENHYPYELFGGMQQRVNLARAHSTSNVKRSSTRARNASGISLRMKVIAAGVPEAARASGRIAHYRRK